MAALLPLLEAAVTRRLTMTGAASLGRKSDTGGVDYLIEMERAVVGPMAVLALNIGKAGSLGVLLQHPGIVAHCTAGRYLPPFASHSLIETAISRGLIIAYG